jgi:hypothetical protein
MIEAVLFNASCFSSSTGICRTTYSAQIRTPMPRITAAARVIHFARSLFIVLGSKYKPLINLTSEVSPFWRGAAPGEGGVFVGIAHFRANPVENPGPQVLAAWADSRTAKLQLNISRLLFAKRTSKQNQTHTLDFSLHFALPLFIRIASHVAIFAFLIRGVSQV